MRSDKFQVDCEYFTTQPVQRPSVGGKTSVTANPVCLKPGTPNNPPSLDRPFAKNCATCEYNKWQDE